MGCDLCVKRCRLVCFTSYWPEESLVAIVIIAAITLICLAGLIPDSFMSSVFLTIGPYVCMMLILVLFRNFIIDRANRTLLPKAIETPTEDGHSEHHAAADGSADSRDRLGADNESSNGDKKKHQDAKTTGRDEHGTTITTADTLYIRTARTTADELCGTKNILSSFVFVVIFVCLCICTGCMYKDTTNSNVVMAFFGGIIWAAGTLVWGKAHCQIIKTYDI